MERTSIASCADWLAWRIGVTRNTANEKVRAARALEEALHRHPEYGPLFVLAARREIADGNPDVASMMIRRAAAAGAPPAA